jgi:trk system potassium uptake protein TrkA
MTEASSVSWRVALCREVWSGDRGVEDMAVNAGNADRVPTAHQLVEDGHEVVLIDIDRDRLDELADGLDCAMNRGDGTLPSPLRDAYGDGSDALVALTNVDDVNIVATMVGRAVGFDRVIPQTVRSELLSVVEELDLD